MNTGPTSFFGNNIDGTLPFDVALLSSLDRIVLSRQVLKGSVPESWDRMSTLETLIIGGNELSGTFPEFLIQNNPMLGTIYFSNNNISGTLPLSVSSESLRDLRLDQNQLSGPIPAGISNLPNLSKFRRLSSCHAQCRLFSNSLLKQGFCTSITTNLMTRFPSSYTVWESCGISV